MPSDAAVSTFLDELYDAAIFPQRWPDAVAGFRNLLNEDVGNVITHLTVVDAAAGSHSHNMVSGADSDMISQGNKYYLDQDLYAIAGYRKIKEMMRKGEERLVLVSPEALEPRDLLSTEYYHDFLRPYGLTDMMCAVSFVDQSKLFTLVANPIHSRTFEQQDKDLVLQLFPHIDRAFRMSVKLGYAQAGQAVAYLWENSELPVMVAQQGRLTYANQAAERVMRTSGILARSGGGLTFIDESANAALRSLARAPRPVHAEPDRPRQAAMELHDRNGEGWMLQMVRMNPPRQDASAQLFSIDPGVFVMLTPLSTASAVRAGSIDSIATFTAMEKELLHALVDGQSIQQIASRTGRSEATLRWHVRNLLSKSGLKNMTDLIRFASLLMPF
jgi:DNA-binding CsgD family transcriptional regulator